MVAWMNYLTSWHVGVVAPFPLYSQNPGTKIMVTVFISQPTLLGMLENMNDLPQTLFGHIFQCWYWNIVLGMHETRLRDDLLCKSKREKHPLHASASEFFHEEVHLKYIVDFKFWQAMENLNNFLVIQLWHFYFIVSILKKMRSPKAFMGAQVIG